MSEGLDRDEMMRRLERLGSESDEDALAAAREIHAALTAAGLSWDELLVGEDEGEPPANEDEPDADEGEDEDEPDAEKDDTEDEPDTDEDDAEDEPDANEDEPDADEDEPDADEDEPDADEDKPAPVAPGDAGVFAAIERLLARDDIAEATREELEGYKDDLADGEFDESDRAYLRALEARISRRN